jgi:hypothetical protein
MDFAGRTEERRRPYDALLCGALAGLDSGVLAALAALAFLALTSRLGGGFWWEKFNIAASPFYGDRVFQLGLGRATWAGAALLLVIYALLGCIFGLLLRGTRGAVKIGLSAVIFALGWHLTADKLLWNHLSPFALRYFSRAATLPAHLAFALFLLRYGRRYQRIGAILGDNASATSEAPIADSNVQSVEETAPPAQEDQTIGEKDDSGASGLLE